MVYIALWVTLLFILQDVLARFAFMYQDGFFLNLHCIIGYGIMGCIHKHLDETCNSKMTDGTCDSNTSK